MTKTKSKKLLSEKFTLPHSILDFLAWGSNTTDYLRISLGITKQNLQYWIKKMIKEGLINRPHHGIIEITDVGKTILDKYEKLHGKDLVRLENMRYRFPIIKNFKYLLNNFTWKKTTILNNIQILHDEIWGFKIRVICANNPSIEIYCKQKLGTDIYEMMYEAKRDAIGIAEIFKEDTKVSLGEPEPAMQPEWAIPSELSEALLSITRSSQIRTPLGILNRSKGRNADLEVRDPRYALAVLEIPKTLQTIKKMISSFAYQNSSISFL